MSLKTNARIAVIGSGVSSLTFTYLLSKLRPDLRITVLEKAAKPSGYIQSEIHEIQGQRVVLEKGPRTLRGSSDGSVLIVDMLKRLGKSDAIKYIGKDSIANKKYLLSNRDKPVQVPNSFGTFRSFWKNGFIKGVPFGMLKEPFVGKGELKDESIDSFFGRRISPNLSRNIISAVYHGIYAGDVRKLSILSIMPSLKKLETDYGSIVKGLFKKPKATKAGLSPELKKYNELFKADALTTKKEIMSFPMLTFQGGLETLTSALYDNLSKNSNIIFKFNEPVTSILKTQQVISVNAEEYDIVRSSVSFEVLESLIPQNTISLPQKVNYVDILLINVFIPKDLMPIHGFGYLVPLAHSNPDGQLGCIFDSEVEKHSQYLYKASSEPINQDYTKLTLMFGGHFYSTSKPKVNDTYVHSLTQRTLESHLGIDITEHQTYVSYKYWDKCIPQFEVGYNESRVQFKEQLEQEFGGKLVHGGMTFGDGVGVPDVVMNSFRDVLNLI